MNTPTLTTLQEKQAPWHDIEPIEIEVTVCMSMSKSFKIKVSDYTRDEEGINLSNCDLEEAVRRQVYLPDEVGTLLDNANIKVAAKDLSNWNIDDFEIIVD